MSLNCLCENIFFMTMNFFFARNPPAFVTLKKRFQRHVMVKVFNIVTSWIVELFKFILQFIDGLLRSERVLTVVKIDHTGFISVQLLPAFISTISGMGN